MLPAVDGFFFCVGGTRDTVALGQKMTRLVLWVLLLCNLLSLADSSCASTDILRHLCEEDEKCLLMYHANSKSEFTYLLNWSINKHASLNNGIHFYEIFDHLLCNETVSDLDAKTAVSILILLEPCFFNENFDFHKGTCICKTGHSCTIETSNKVAWNWFAAITTILVIIIVAILFVLAQIKKLNSGKF